MTVQWRLGRAIAFGPKLQAELHAGAKNGGQALRECATGRAALEGQSHLEIIGLHLQRPILVLDDDVISSGYCSLRKSGISTFAWVLKVR